MQFRSRACLGVPAMAGLAWILAALARGTSAAAAPAAGELFANHVVVRKAAHMLYLYHDQQLLGAYPIELGLDPVGPKEREDDFRTPEGHYRLERRDPRSDYFLSIQISYPNKQDAARAKRHHWAPGDDIMIHGTPNAPRLPGAYYRTKNWTNGCIALSDSNMIEVWMKTKDDTPIDIYP